MAKEKQEKQIDLLQGTLDLLILKAVSLGPLHGYGVLLHPATFGRGTGDSAGIVVPRTLSIGASGRHR